MEYKLRPRPQFEAPHYRAAGKLEGKTALITGGDSGIGRAVAVLYAKEGANVAITFLPEEERVARETKRVVEGEGRRCLLLAGDLTDPDFCAHIVERTLQEFGKLDILVNNAAFQQHQELLDYSATKGAIHGFTKSLAQNLVDRVIRVNCVAPGPVWTPLNPSDSDAEEVEDFGASQPMNVRRSPRKSRRPSSSSPRMRIRPTSREKCSRCLAGKRRRDR